MDAYIDCRKAPEELKNCFELLARECKKDYKGRCLIEKMGNICGEYNRLLAVYKKLTRSKADNALGRMTDILQDVVSGKYFIATKIGLQLFNSFSIKLNYLVL